MKKIIGVIIAVIVLAGIVFFIFNSSNNSTTGNVVANSNAPVHVINLTAQRFTYSPNVIHVKQGEKVLINVDNVDTQHGIAIPDYNVAGVTSVEFTADKAGTFSFHCPTMCGPGHREMTGTLIVDPS